jgi:hypothetical protein
MYAIGKEQAVKFSFGIYPEAGSRKACMAEAGRGKEIPA